MSEAMIERIRQALGRTLPLDSAPVPPKIDDGIARLVERESNLADVFARSAAAAKCIVTPVSSAAAGSAAANFLSAHQCITAGLPESALLDRLGFDRSLAAVGIGVVRWNESSLDAAYDLSAGITDVYAAVAETGSLAIRPGPGHGRALSLVPPIHVAVVQRRDIVADLIDLLEQINRERPAPNITLITGPSKTADIEGALVTGVHGPGIVKILLLED
jgi:L-lactate utilization protein LutC